MKLPYSGGCACGAIRYTGEREPIAMLNCHCIDCQRSSGAPFASGIVAKTEDLRVSGTPKAYAVRASSGGLATRSFCAECGTPLFTSSEAHPDITSIRFPSLDDTSAFKPMLDIYAASAQQWVCLDQAIPHFPQSPEPPK
ncbi:GFA family protein [Massilia forsythiae]|uniref:GFA family protein n=1 Tax=Massilia forsythiae TaxID=2728020 RepID=A0A7Z2VTI1_9BURK|nr:GFA family protein [Massilia forsythiae]QJD98814.1 GFA family protein [Massilia forsythiae]